MTPPDLPRVVSDTGVYLRATINAANVSSSLLRRAASGEIQLYVSHDLLAEVRDVLTRPEIRVKNARLSDEALEAFLAEIQVQARLIDPCRSMSPMRVILMTNTSSILLSKQKQPTSCRLTMIFST